MTLAGQIPLASGHGYANLTVDFDSYALNRSKWQMQEGRTELPFCPNCGKEYTQKVDFCPNCGKQVAGSQVAATSSSTGSSVQENVKYCQKCGAPNDIGVSYCQKCGEVRFSSSAPATITRPTGVTILAILQLIGSVIMIVTGIGLAILGGFGLVIAIIGILELIFASALFSGRNWARTLMLVGAVLDIISIVGIIWGIILLWYMTRPRVVAYFKQPK